MHRTWVRFIKGDDPGWVAYDCVNRTTGLLTDTITEVQDPDGDERQSWPQFRS